MRETGQLEMMWYLCTCQRCRANHSRELVIYEIENMTISQKLSTFDAPGIKQKMLTFDHLLDIQDERLSPVNALFDNLFIQQTKK